MANNPARIKPMCVICGDTYARGRRVIGHMTCLSCGEEQARAVKHCIVPMPKSNYIVVTDPALLVGLNSSHKGGKT